MKITPEIELHVKRCHCGRFFGAEQSQWGFCQMCQQRDVDSTEDMLLRTNNRHSRVVRGLRQYIARLKRELDR